MVTYRLSTGNDHQLHVHKIRGNKARCGAMLTPVAEVEMNDATNIDVAKLLNEFNRGCFKCLSELMGLPHSTNQNRRK